MTESATRPAVDGGSAAAVEDEIELFFSPNGGCTDAIAAEIGKAKKSILVQAYRLTSAPIAKALSDANARGVNVIVLLDSAAATPGKYSDATYFANHEMIVRVDAKHAIAHNKVIVIDDGTVITGSFNFTKAAEDSNAENILILRNKPLLASAYARNFARHMEHAETFRAADPAR